MCPFDRFTTGPRRPFWLKLWLELMCREKSLPCSAKFNVSRRALHRACVVACCIISVSCSLKAWTGAFSTASVSETS